MAGKAVAKAEATAVPDLRHAAPTLDITSEDIALPRVYVGQYSSEAVKHRLVDPGDIYVANGPDDPDPSVLWNSGSEDPGVLFHVLGLKKGKSYSAPGQPLELYDYDDPNAPEDAWITYNYTVLLPEFDTEIPAKFLLTRTGRPAAKQINTVIKKNEARGPAWANAFRVTTAHRNNKNGDYYVARISVVEASQDHVSLAGEMAVAMTSQASDFGARGEEPEI